MPRKAANKIAAKKIRVPGTTLTTALSQLRFEEGMSERSLAMEKEKKNLEPNEKSNETYKTLEDFRIYMQKIISSGKIGDIDKEQLNGIGACITHIQEKNNQEKKQTNVSPTLDVSSESGECETQRRQKIGENLELLPDKQIGEGNNEGNIFEGTYKVPVAVKRISKDHMDANKIQRLITESQDHPNLVTYYGTECDNNYYYIAMEKQYWGETAFNWDELVQIARANSNLLDGLTKGGHTSTSVAVQLNDRLEFVKRIVGDLELIPKNGSSIPDFLLTLMRKALSGLVQLHELGISHGDLSPQNIRIIKKGSSWCLKLSDIGIRTGSDTWIGKAPQQRDDPSTDIYSLGQIFSYLLTGESPSTEWKKVGKSSKSLVGCPEADHLISLMKSPAESRPTAKELLCHLLFWPSEKKLSFLRDAIESAKGYPELEEALDNIQVSTVGEGKGHKGLLLTWDKRIDDLPDLISYMQERQTYNVRRVLSLLQFIRNIVAHYEEIDREHNIKQSVGTLYSGLEGQLSRRYPRLSIEVFEAFCKNCKEAERFRRYSYEG